MCFHMYAEALLFLPCPVSAKLLNTLSVYAALETF